MVLANNVYQLDKIETEVSQLTAKMEGNEKVTLFQLRATRNKVENWINNSYLPAIFQYPSEKDLYFFGSDHRGILEYKANLENEIKSLDDLKDELISNREANSDLVMTLLLTLISGFQFQEVFQSFVEGDVLKSWIYTILFSFSLTATIYYFSKLKMKK